MNLKTTKKHLINAYHKRMVPMLWGKPGIGKSSIVKQIANELSIDLIDLRLTQLEPPDVRGIPVPNRETKRAEWFYSDLYPINGEGILFLDEIDKAAKAVKDAALQLVLDRKIGSYHLPKGWSIMAAGNYADDDTFSHTLSAALNNRMIHFNIEPDLDTWIEWARKNNINENIIAYLEFRPQHLYRYEAGATAYPTPRSWEMLNTMLLNIENNVERDEIIAAVVGEVVGVEYRNWFNLYKNVKVDDILIGGNMPDFSTKEKSFIYAVLFAIAHNIAKRDLIGLENNIANFILLLEPEMRAVFYRHIPVEKLEQMFSSKSPFKKVRDLADELINKSFGL